MNKPPAGYDVIFTSQAARDLKRLDPPVRRRLLSALEQLVGDVPRGDVRALNGRPGQFRLRVSDWRALYRLEHEPRRLVVLRVLPRGRAYDL